MFLRNLKIFSAGQVVREIPFKQGLNLILDESNPSDHTESSNSVGKTTALRVIDYCFGSDGTDIYQDEEFKQNLNEILAFLRKNSVSAVLEVEHGDERFVLERGFGSPEIMKINGEDYESIESYRRVIEVKMFGIETSKPSLREIMPKFIRKNSEGMSKAIRFGNNFTTNDKYELIYAYLFDFPDPGVVRIRYETQTKLRSIEERLTALRDGKQLPYYRQALNVIDRQIAGLEKRKSTYNIGELYEDRLSTLKEIRALMSPVSARAAKLEAQIQMHLLTVADLRRKSSSADPATLDSLYQEAGRYSEKLSKDFDELLHFHNTMIGNKIMFAESKLALIKDELVEQNKILDSYARQESGILKEMANEGAFSDLESLYGELSRTYEQRGRAQQKVDEIQGKEDERAEIQKALKKLEEEVKLATSTFEVNITRFNEFFSDYSKRLYDQSFVLSQTEPGSLRLQIDNIEGNVGSGKKKAAIAAFDMAYIDYVSATSRSDRPKFVIHNGIEEIGNNQLDTLFAIANNTDRQYIVAVIRDRMNFIDPKFLKANTVLSLRQDDKFFRF